MSKQILIISYLGNINAMAASHHIDDRLAFFAKKGVDVHLLTSVCGKPYKDRKQTRVPSCAPSGIRYELRYLLRRRTKTRLSFKLFETVLLLPVLPFYLIEKLLLRLDSTWSWSITASVAATLLAFRLKPSVIYSTGGPVSAHIAATVASRLTGVAYIAEFQDPLVHEYAAPGRLERWFMKKVERMVFKRAKAVLFLTKEAAEKGNRRNASTKGAAIYAGAQKPENNAQYKKEERFTIAHFGSLGGSRNLTTLLGALGALFKESGELAESVRVELYGNSSRQVKREIDAFAFKDIIIEKGKVKREEALWRMHTAALLLLIQNTDDVSFETIPSKTYEYLHTGRPILALVYRNPELSGMLSEQGHSAVEADDIEATKKSIRGYFDLWKETGLKTSVNQSPYTVEAAVEEFIALAGKE